MRISNPNLHKLKMDAVQFSVMHMDIHILDSACARTMKQSTYHFYMSAFHAIYKKKLSF